MNRLFTILFIAAFIIEVSPLSINSFSHKRNQVSQETTTDQVSSLSNDQKRSVVIQAGILTKLIQSAAAAIKKIFKPKTNKNNQQQQRTTSNPVSPMSQEEMQQMEEQAKETAATRESDVTAEKEVTPPEVLTQKEELGELKLPMDTDKDTMADDSNTESDDTEKEDTPVATRNAESATQRPSNGARGTTADTGNTTNDTDSDDTPVFLDSDESHAHMATFISSGKSVTNKPGEKPSTSITAPAIAPTLPVPAPDEKPVTYVTSLKKVMAAFPKEGYSIDKSGNVIFPNGQRVSAKDYLRRINSKTTTRLKYSSFNSNKSEVETNITLQRQRMMASYKLKKEKERQRIRDRIGPASANIFIMVETRVKEDRPVWGL